MSQTNYRTRPIPIYTAEGARAKHIGPQQQLLRLTMSCMLWEDNFYIDGKTVGDAIAQAVHACTLEQAAAVAIEARTNMKLRHVPLLIVREMARHPHRTSKLAHLGKYRMDDSDPAWISQTLAAIIQRPDELTEFMAIYWKDGKQPLSKQVKLGLAKAFAKFDEYALAKYNRKKDISLKDVLFLCHSKPADGQGNWTKQTRAAYAKKPFPFEPMPGELLYGKLIYDQLQTPDTWEVQLSGGADKALTFIRLMNERKLGDLAFLRNLRNMVQAGVPKNIITEYGDSRNWGRVLPFRFIAAARILPEFEPDLERWMFKCLEGSTMLGGKTILLVDVSGSMCAPLSSKSDLRRTDAAQALAMLLREVCTDPVIVPFGSENLPLVPVPPRRGFALAELVRNRNTGTKLGRAVAWANFQGYDRLIVLTDEQSFDVVGAPLTGTRSYMLNVASEKNGIGYYVWNRIDGFSEAVVDYIQKFEERHWCLYGS